MKRNMDLVRALLLSIEKDGCYKSLEKQYGSHEIRSHITLLMGGGQIVSDSSFREPLQLRWQGHELLDKIRDEQRWKTLKKMLGQPGDFSYETITQAVSSLVADQLKTLIPLAIWTVICNLTGLVTWLVGTVVVRAFGLW